MDVCPVGAITTRDYRFKSRPWDNPTVSDTICTMCSKGCSTSAWIKAKPEWAKGTQLVRMTPRLNPAVNSYWMCDIGRFDFRWVEGESRLRKPLVRQGGTLQPVGWHDVEPKVREALQSAGAADPMSVRFLVSAHTATEDLFVLRELVEGLQGAEGVGAVAVAWRHTLKSQPAGTQFVVPSTDAPNVNGARDLGFSTGAGNAGPADVSTLRRAVEAGHVRIVYVIDPGPEGSLGDTSWLANAREQGTLATLIVQGVVSTALTAVADIVLPGAAWVEKDALYTNDQGMVQASSRAVAPPGDAREDWLILVGLGRALGLSFGYQTSGDVRKALAAALPSGPYATAERAPFTRPVPASTWLQASNPSERWKWDFMYQDLPPVKGHSVQTEGMAADGRRAIQLTPVT
jgi:NADH-quinone oxidoreductase subunit G